MRANFSGPHQDDCDLVTVLRETILAGWASALRAVPHGMRSSYPVGVIADDVVELLPTKSLDSRWDGSPWLHPMERVFTPCSLEDLGDFTLGPVVPDVGALLKDTAKETLPYTVCPATRTLALVQHEPGYHPTDAPFMFVGQRQRVERVIGVPWKQAAELAETLPEAADLGPVLVIQMTGRCGSTVFCKVLEWLDVGCQSVSEPTVFAEVHEMLERGLCTREEAIPVLRAFMLMLVHQRRQANKKKPLIVIKNRTLAASWRACELLPEAVPEVKQLFQWRTMEDVVGSFYAAVRAATISPTAQFLMEHGYDATLWQLWQLNGAPQVQWMRRVERSLREEAALGLALPSTAGQDVHMEPEAFARHGALGFLTFMSIFDSHIAVALGRRGLWAFTLKYEDLMERKSACVQEVLQALGWLHLVPNPALLGTPEADSVFLKDAHSGGGLTKESGTSAGGDQQHLAKARAAEAAGAARQNAHLPPHRAEVVRKLLRRHGPLQARAFDIDAALAEKELEKEVLPCLIGRTSVLEKEKEKLPCAPSGGTPLVQSAVLHG